jgi:hypothetical protein
VRKRKKPARRRRTPARRSLRIVAVGAAPAPTAPPPPPVAAATQVEQRGLPLVAALARVARGAGSPRARLESAMRILFTAYGASDPDFSGLFLAGWARARHDKQFRLTLAWQREQIRLSIEDILAEGVRMRGFRADLDAGAVSAVIMGAAEGCLLQAATEGGAITGERLVRSLLTLAVSGA